MGGGRYASTPMNLQSKIQERNIIAEERERGRGQIRKKKWQSLVQTQV